MIKIGEISVRGREGVFAKQRHAWWVLFGILVTFWYVCEEVCRACLSHRAVYWALHGVYFLPWLHASSQASPVAHRCTLTAGLYTHLHLLPKMGLFHTFLPLLLKRINVTCDFRFSLFFLTLWLFSSKRRPLCYRADFVLPAICRVWNLTVFHNIPHVRRWYWCLLCLKDNVWKFSNSLWRSYRFFFKSLEYSCSTNHEVNEWEGIKQTLINWIEILVWFTLWRGFYLILGNSGSCSRNLGSAGDIPGIDLRRLLGIWTSAFFCLWNDTAVLATTLCSEKEYNTLCMWFCLKALLPWKWCGHLYHSSRWLCAACLFAVYFNSLWLSKF